MCLQCQGSLLSDLAIDAFTQQVGVPAVPGVLLDPVYQQFLIAMPSLPARSPRSGCSARSASVAAFLQRLERPLEF